MIVPSLLRDRSSSGQFLIKSKLNSLVVDVVGNGQEPLNHLVVYPVKGTKGEQTQQGTITEKRLKRSRLNNLVLGMKERI